MKGSADSGEELEPPTYEGQLIAYWETEFRRRSIPTESGITTSTGDLIEIADDTTSLHTELMGGKDIVRISNLLPVTSRSFAARPCKLSHLRPTHRLALQQRSIHSLNTKAFLHRAKLAAVELPARKATSSRPYLQSCQ
jgi:hypothetical protein